MTEYSDQLKAIIAERDSLRHEIMLMVRSIHQAGFAFVTVVVKKLKKGTPFKN